MHDFCFAYVFHVVEVHTDIWYAKQVHAFQPNYIVPYKLIIYDIY